MGSCYKITLVLLLFIKHKVIAHFERHRNIECISDGKLMSGRRINRLLVASVILPQIETVVVKEKKITIVRRTFEYGILISSTSNLLLLERDQSKFSYFVIW